MGIAEIRHDAASLSRFVESIASFCVQQSGTPSYVEGSRLLFNHFVVLSESTSAFLATFPSSQEFVAGDPLAYIAQRQKLKALRLAWSVIHQRLKAVADADTLHIPTALLHWLQRRSRQIEGLSKYSFAVFHTERVNFLHLERSEFPSTSDQIAEMVGADKFPPLSLIGIPYSQADSLFFNCIIPHEIGHSIFSAKKIADVIKLAAGPSLNTRLKAQDPQIIPNDRLRLLDLVQTWAEELFCDFVAIWLLGPAFAFASIEVRDLVNSIDHRGVFNSEAGGVTLEFGSLHPAHLYRLKQQVLLLDKLEWWDLIKAGKSHYISLMSAAAQMPDTRFVAPKGISSGHIALSTLLEIVPTILREVHLIFEGVDPGSRGYKLNGKHIVEALQNGVVPSTLKIKKRTVYPSPIAIVNAAYDVYLNSLDVLIGRIAGRDPASIADRAFWTRKLEKWASKAMEDVEARESGDLA